MTDFPTLDVAGVATGILLSRTGGIGGIHAVLDFMTGDALMTHQLPRAAAAVGPAIVAQHPWLDGLTVDTDRLQDWCAALLAERGEHLALTAVPDSWQRRDPIAELQEMAGDRPIIVVALDGDRQ